MTNDLMTGYQWGHGNRFIGIYKFEANRDQAAVHLPHNTTLTPPPKDIPSGQVAVWDEGRGRWDVREAPAPVMSRAIELPPAAAEVQHVD